MNRETASIVTAGFDGFKPPAEGGEGVLGQEGSKALAGGAPAGIVGDVEAGELGERGVS